MRKAAESLNAAARKDALPLDVYGADIFHSTISDYRTADGFVDDEPHRLVIDELAPVIRQAVVALPRITRNHCAIGYRRRLLCNQTTVIAPGEPSEEWLIIVERIIERCLDAGIPLREPWGAHMTLARFHDACLPSQSGGFLRAAAAIKLDVTLCPRFIGLGAFTCTTRNGFRVEWRHRIRLR